MRPLLAFALIAAAGCVAPAADEGSTSDLPITSAPAGGSPAWAARITFDGGRSCSASILAERWLVTAAHCFDRAPQALTDLTIYRATGAGAPFAIYIAGRATAFISPLYHAGQASSANDVALVRLDTFGLGLARTERAKIYTDTRRPWSDASTPRAIAIAGWGDGSDRGGETDCFHVALPDGTLRASEFADSSAHDGVVAVTIGATQLCRGDSGGPWFVKRGARLQEEPMLFAVTSGFAGTQDEGALLEPSLAWIQRTISAQTSPALRVTFPASSTNGWKNQMVDVASRGYGSLRSQGGRCLTVSAIQSGSPIVVRACDGTTTQSWSFAPSGEMRSGIAPQASCLEVTGGGSQMMTRMATCDGSLRQKLVLTPAGALEASIAPGQCVMPAAPFDGSLARLAPCDGSPAQAWAW